MLRCHICLRFPGGRANPNLAAMFANAQIRRQKALVIVTPSSSLHKQLCLVPGWPRVDCPIGSVVAMFRGVLNSSQPDLAKIGQTMGHSGHLPSPPQGRHEQGGQDGDDGNHDQQLDQGESPLFFPVFSRSGCMGRDRGDGVGDRTRTGDVQLGKLTFYH